MVSELHLCIRLAMAKICLSISPSSSPALHAAHLEAAVRLCAPLFLHPMRPKSAAAYWATRAAKLTAEDAQVPFNRDPPTGSVGLS